MKSMLLGITVAFALFGPGNLYSQTSQDSIATVESKPKVKKGSIISGRPGKAFLMSLVLPGAGQIYNKSYLRVPFVWGAVGGVGALMIHNTQQYQCYRDAYVHLIDGTPMDDLPEHCTKHDSNDDHIPDIEQIDAQSMRLLRDQANKNKQAAILGFAAVWFLQSVDAFVDAHLKQFDINEDLTFDFKSQYDDDPNAPMRMGLYVQF